MAEWISRQKVANPAQVLPGFSVAPRAPARMRDVALPVLIFLWGLAAVSLAALA